MQTADTHLPERPTNTRAAALVPGHVRLSMSALFWFVAGALAGAAATAAIGPLWRIGAAQPHRHTLRIAVAAGGACTFAAIAAIAYLTSGSARSFDRTETAAGLADHPAAEVASSSAAPSTGKVPSMEEATARLEARLSQGGGSPQDWQLLAQSYEFLGRAADAQRARAHVVAGTTAPQLSGISDATLAAGAAIMQGSSLAAPAADTGATPEPSESHEASGISGTVSIEARLASSVAPGAVLFIYAKAADSPGPPLAVMRVTANAWPVPFHLDDSMAMLPARRLSQFPRVVIEARVSRTGQATPGPGDLYVTSDVISPGAARKLALVINHQIG